MAKRVVEGMAGMNGVFEEVNVLEYSE